MNNMEFQLRVSTLMLQASKNKSISVRGSLLTCIKLWPFIEKSLELFVKLYRVASDEELLAGGDMGTDGVLID